jgi:hypothetical protein
LEEFSFKGLTPDYLTSVSSKAKAKLTRTYNITNHRSQALASDTALGGRKRKTAAASAEGSLADVADDRVAKDTPTRDSDAAEDSDGSAVAGADQFRKKKRATSKGKKAPSSSAGKGSSTAKKSRK